MRITRLVAGTVTAGLLGITPIAISAAAQAAVTVVTATSLSSTQVEYTYGDRIFFDAAVTTNDPNNAYAPGSATLYMMRGGTTAWEAVSTDEGVSYLYFTDLTAVANAQYKVVYPGGTDGTGDVYLPSESPVFAISTARKMTIKNPRGTFVKGKISPDYKNKKVLVQKKVGKQWKKFRALKTNTKSQFQITLPATRKRTFWRFLAKGNTEFATATFEGSTISYRFAAPRVTLR